MEGKSNTEAAAMIAQARQLVAALPIDEAKSMDSEFAGIFKKKRKKASDKVTGRQAEVEKEWDDFVVKNYAEAKQLAEAAKAKL